MKTKLKYIHFICGIAAIFALSITTTASAKNPKEVELKISNDELIITTRKAENDCPSVLGEFRKNGCIKVGKNEQSDIYFHLKGDMKCGLESGTNWELNAVYLGGFNSKRKPSGDFGFTNTSNANFAKVKADFNISEANRANGLVTVTSKSDRKITITDKNLHEYVVWYKIEAICKREDGKDPHTRTSDPRVKNGGTE